MVASDLWIKRLSGTTFKGMIFCYDSTVYKNVCAYLKIGLTGMLMLCFEWWAFELLAIFTGLLGVKDLAAEVVIINIVTFIFMMPLGISYAASALTGNFLGKTDIVNAKSFATLAVVFNIILTTIIVIIFWSCTEGISKLFT